MTIEEFLEARLAEDEQIARAAGASDCLHWAYDGDDPGADREGEVYVQNPHSNVRDRRAVTRGNEEGTVPGIQLEDGRHVARHDPARVLREAAAKRRALEAFRDDPSALDVSGMMRHIALREFVIKPMAAIWSDHPDYQKEWQ